MMNEATRLFISQHWQDDVRELALRGTKDPEVNLAFALQQIDGRRRAQEKLPSWAAIEGIVWPPHLSMEQCSSEVTARYKAKVAGGGSLFVDLTAGFGVDAAFIAAGFERAVCVELQKELCAISSANFEVLGLRQIEEVNGNGVDYLHAMEPADLVFIDPARRDEHGGRTYGIADCTPNVLEIIDEMEEKAVRIMIKLSPMLDWRKAVEDIGRQHVAAVHIVSVNNECKELLIVMEGRTRSVKGKYSVHCVNLLADGRTERFSWSVESDSWREECGGRSEICSEGDSAAGVFSLHLPPSSLHESPSTTHYLYEPNASVMKAGCFDLLEAHFGVRALHQNSHLFVSDRQVDGFPGRGFVIERETSMNKRELKASLADITQANIAVRNFPLSVAELRKRLRIQDGGNVYIFATTTAKEGHRLFICKKIS